ncbi:MAG: YajQ family cyclic di-GMP-binding protein [Elusimicrobia bacterium]|nr:YajQ family cyclic di-GMP-binding protein [Elusimicrobiota bacterium]
MGQEFSFDVVSKVDMQGVEDAVNTCMKEISTRFDFKGSISRLELDKKTGEILLYSDDEYKLKSVYDILQTRLVKRGAPLKNFVPQKIELAAGSTVRQAVKIQQGIPSDKAKEMAQVVKQSGLKAQPSIQSDQIRISSRSKDELQQVMALLRSKDFGLELQFTNYR